MLAPVDKLERGGNNILQIVITTACDRACSNCTQLLAWRTDYKFMSVDCFRDAVESVRDWPGIVALFGGNPCVHPKFAEFCEILSSKIPPRRRGLWSNHLFKHGKVASETFSQGVLNLNAHGDPDAFAAMTQWFGDRVIKESGTRRSMHSPILLDPKDFGIEDTEWEKKRERCDINTDWSGAIVERGGRPYGYFCEVAAALDGIRGENSGVPAVPGWWRGRMEIFASQVKHCCDRGCGYPLRGQGHYDTDEVQDVSRSWRETLPAVKAAVNPVEVLGGQVRKSTDYLRRLDS